VDYCLVILKYYKKGFTGNVAAGIKAIKEAVKQNVDMINYSGGGKDPIEIERKYVNMALDKNMVFVAAAGNEGKSFEDQTYYPAMYRRDIIVVGNLMVDDNRAVRAPSSNYGEEVDLQVFGTDIKSVNGEVMTGTSQSTAIVTGRIAKYVKSYRLTEAMRKLNNQGRDNYYSPLYKFMK